MFGPMYSFVGFQVKAGSVFGNGSRKGGNGEEEDEDKPVEKFLVKWSGMSYLHVSWETYEDLLENGGKMINMKVLDDSCWFVYFFTDTRARNCSNH